jgi:endonuclease III
MQSLLQMLLRQAGLHKKKKDEIIQTSPAVQEMD